MLASGFAVALFSSLPHFILAGAGLPSQTCSDPAVCSNAYSDEVAYLQSHIKVLSQSSSSVDTRQHAEAPLLSAHHPAAHLQTSAVDTEKHDEVPPLPAHRQVARLQASRPVSFIHVPKCGSSFMNALLYLPGMCQSMPQGYVVEGNYDDLLDNVDQWCPGSFASEGRVDFEDHSGVCGFYKSSVEGHGFVMLRQPEQRLISGYFYGQHSWPLWYYGRYAENLLEYTRVMSGCAVRMFTREGSGSSLETQDTIPSVCGGPEPVTTAEVALAKHRLRTGFAFVGITDEWDLSVCLLHRVYGGDCLSTDFVNMRPGHNSSDDLYDTSELKGYKDLADGALYDEALAIFSEQTQRYGVNYESCQPCFQQASSSK